MGHTLGAIRFAGLSNCYDIRGVACPGLCDRQSGEFLSNECSPVGAARSGRSHDDYRKPCPRAGGADET
jgi:hypothetical protein